MAVDLGFDSGGTERPVDCRSDGEASFVDRSAARRTGGRRCRSRGSRAPVTVGPWPIEWRRSTLSRWCLAEARRLELAGFDDHPELTARRAIVGRVGIGPDRDAIRPRDVRPTRSGTAGRRVLRAGARQPGAVAAASVAVPDAGTIGSSRDANRPHVHRLRKNPAGGHGQRGHYREPRDGHHDGAIGMVALGRRGTVSASDPSVPSRTKPIWMGYTWPGRMPGPLPERIAERRPADHADHGALRHGDNRQRAGRASEIRSGPATRRSQAGPAPTHNAAAV